MEESPGSERSFSWTFSLGPLDRNGWILSSLVWEATVRCWKRGPVVRVFSPCPGNRSPSMGPHTFGAVEHPIPSLSRLNGKIEPDEPLCAVARIEMQARIGSHSILVRTTLRSVLVEDADRQSDFRQAPVRVIKHIAFKDAKRRGRALEHDFCQLRWRDVRRIRFWRGAHYLPAEGR